jgi:hypothetical protein
MKVASTLINPGESLNDEAEASWQMDGLDQTPASSYARDLRVVGQLLERRQITSADLVCVADAYIIRGIQKSSGDSRFLSYLARRFMTRLHAVLHCDFCPSLPSRVINLRYDLEEIVKADYLARCKRSSISPLPDPYSLSHILRTAGAYLDGRKNSSLIGISLQDPWITIRFETAEGNPEEAKQNRQHFYDYWVKMYLRRASQGQMSGSNLQRNSFVANRHRT